MLSIFIGWTLLELSFEKRAFSSDSICSYSGLATIAMAVNYLQHSMKSRLGKMIAM